MFLNRISFAVLWEIFLGGRKFWGCCLFRRFWAFLGIPIFSLFSWIFGTLIQSIRREFQAHNWKDRRLKIFSFLSLLILCSVQHSRNFEKENNLLEIPFGYPEKMRKNRPIKSLSLSFAHYFDELKTMAVAAKKLFSTNLNYTRSHWIIWLPTGISYIKAFKVKKMKEGKTDF